MGMLMRRSYSDNKVKEQTKTAPTPVKEEKIDKEVVKEKTTKKK